MRVYVCVMSCSGVICRYQLTFPLFLGIATSYSDKNTSCVVDSLGSLFKYFCIERRALCIFVFSILIYRFWFF